MLDRILIGSSAEPSDPNFKNVTLLLHGDGSNGAQNNTFIDSSTNNFTITRNGNTTQGSFSPYGSNWSNYFDGNGDYLQTPSNSAFALNGTSFTIEAWVYVTSSSEPYQHIVKTSGASNNLMYIDYSGGSNGVLSSQVGGTTASQSGVTLNTWHHLAVVRNGTSVTSYVNGVGGTPQTIDPGSSGSVSLIIATDGGPSPIRYFNGYISNLRVVKGTAVYTSNFTPPTAPLTAIANTSLLTCADNRFRDGSTNNFTITRNGDVKVTNFAPFAPSSAYSATTNGGSAYFDGTGDYLTVANNGNFDFGSGDFTVECWVYVNDSADNDGIVGIWGTGKQSWILYREGANWQFFYSGPSGSPLVSSVGVTVGTWVHLAVVRSGSTLTFYHNGVSTGTKNVGTTAFTSNSTQNLGIGVNLDGTGNILNGYMSDLRIVKGTAVYTSGFTPPTSPLSAVTNTNLLMKPTNAAIFDNSMKNDLETVGNAQISTSVKKFGTGSMYFDGTGDWLVAPGSPELTMGTGDFTIEFWINVPSFANFRQHISTRTSENSSYWSIDSKGDGKFYFYTNTFVVTSAAQSTNTWIHIAAVRSSGTFTLYINGTSQGSVSLTNNFLQAPLGIGAASDGQQPMVGYIDDLRITKGVARYTSNFTAPTAPFPNK